MLKQVILSLMVLAFLTSCQNGDSDVRDAARQNIENDVQPANPQPATQSTAATGPSTSMEFEETEFDFGTINEGEKVAHTYRFKNTGSEPLILSDAR
ncbi:MAG: DUF1573 domain-containing protein, partial [Saprospiraceae bacterium]|nr:DUF1573 domain-containing protein [Saprospiraceae bacterium]